MKSQARLRLRRPSPAAMVTMVRIGRVFWRCRCGANVLTQRGNLFTCNGCGTLYEGIA